MTIYGRSTDLKLRLELNSNECCAGSDVSFLEEVKGFRDVGLFPNAGFGVAELSTDSEFYSDALDATLRDGSGLHPQVLSQAISTLLGFHSCKLYIIIYVKRKKKTQKFSSKALGLSFYLQKLYKINNGNYIVRLNNNTS